MTRQDAAAPKKPKASKDSGPTASVALINLLLFITQKRRTRTILLCITVLLGSTLLARVHPFGDAGLHRPSPAAAPVSSHSIPPPVRELLNTKCADCHSTQTRAPIYSRLAPFSWLMERDIVEGREHMDLSAWDAYTPEKQQTLQSKIIQQTKAGKMPLPQYRLIHWSSTITPADRQLLTTWAHQDSAQQDTAASSNQSTTAADAAQGKLVFAKRCTGCHSLQQNREGPNLSGLFGRPAGRAPNFTYSDALKNANFTWNEQNLNRWLTDPDAFLPGNNMDFHVAKPQERHDLIRFFKANAR